MHYTGMAAMRMMPGVVYDPLLFSRSVLFAVLASGAALWIAFRLRHDTGRVWVARFGASVVMGFVGAGGLGQQIDLSMRMFAGAEVASMLLTFLVLVMLADLLSRFLRWRLA